MTRSEIHREKKADIAAALHARGLELGQARTEIAVLKALVRDQDHTITGLRCSLRAETESARAVQVQAHEVSR